MIKEASGIRVGRFRPLLRRKALFAVDDKDNVLSSHVNENDGPIDYYRKGKLLWLRGL